MATLVNSIPVHGTCPVQSYTRSMTKNKKTGKINAIHSIFHIDRSPSIHLIVFRSDKEYAIETVWKKFESIPRVLEDPFFFFLFEKRKDDQHAISISFLVFQWEKSRKGIKTDPSLCVCVSRITVERWIEGGERRREEEKSREGNWMKNGSPLCLPQFRLEKQNSSKSENGSRIRGGERELCFVILWKRTNERRRRRCGGEKKKTRDVGRIDLYTHSLSHRHTLKHTLSCFGMILILGILWLMIKTAAYQNSAL